MKRLFFIIFLSLSLHMQANNMQAKDTIYYVFDPMCGWCFGFSGVIKQAAKDYQNDFEFVAISGGMVVGEREGPIGDFADYILGAYKRVEDMAGVKFGEPYLAQLKTKTLYSSSVVPSIALAVFREFLPSRTIEFAGSLQDAMFVHGKDLRDDSVYVEMVKPYGIDPNIFIEKLHEASYKEKAFEGFQQSANFGVQGFPAVLGNRKGKYYNLTNGYSSKKELYAVLDKLKTL
jgi:putative protein-disulfide isomerase